MLVDDEHAIVDALQGILEDEGYRVLTAAHGREALARLAEAKPDVALLDVMMPVMGGRELLAHLRASPEWSRLPVLMMSAVPREVLERQEGGALACDAFLEKPFDLGTLLATLDRLAGPEKG
nr:MULTISPECIES: response regulator [Myxococcaceae]